MICLPPAADPDANAALRRLWLWLRTEEVGLYAEIRELIDEHGDLLRMQDAPLAERLVEDTLRVRSLQRDLISVAALASIPAGLAN